MHGSDRPLIFQPVIMTRIEKITIEGYGTRIDSFVKLEGGSGLRIGRGVHIASFSHVGMGGGETVLEDYSALASGAKVISGLNSPEALSISATAPDGIHRVEKRKTVLERYAAVFTNGVVCPGVTLHQGAVLGAGSVATRDIPAWEIWAGVPAKRVRYRLVDGKCPIHQGQRDERCIHCALEIVP